MRVAIIKNESRKNKIFVVEMTLFFLRRNSSATNIPTERISGTQKSPLPTPSKKIGPAGQKKGNLLHVSSKYAPQIQIFCVRLLFFVNKNSFASAKTQLIPLIISAIAEIMRCGVCA